MAGPIYQPNVPYVGPVPGNLQAGKMVRIQGTVPLSADRFVVNLKCGAYESDDIALHLSIRFPQLQVVRNSYLNRSWGPEETFGHMPFCKGQGFELLILCDPSSFKIAVNGQHYTEYPHRTPYERVTLLEIKQDVTLTLIQWEGSTGLVPPAPVGFVPPVSLSYGPDTARPGSPMYGPPPPAYHCPPNHPGCPPVPAVYPVGVPAAPHPPYPQYPPLPPGYSQYQNPYKNSGGILGKAKSMITGALGTPGYGGHTGPGVGPGTAMMTSHLSPKKALKAQKKARKKALKYGLPLAGVAGVGLGTYAISKKLHHGFHSSSSSSSSSSDEE